MEMNAGATEAGIQDSVRRRVRHQDGPGVQDLAVQPTALDDLWMAPGGVHAEAHLRLAENAEKLSRGGLLRYSTGRLDRSQIAVQPGKGFFDHLSPRH